MGTSGVATAYDEKEALDEAEAELHKVCKEQLKSCSSFQKKIVLGSPAMEILWAFKTDEIDLIAMGPHGQRGGSHIFFGSVAESVIQSSRVPVLIVNPEKFD